MLSTINNASSSILMLDTQASIHLISNPDLLSNVQPSMTPVTVQGITGDKMRVTLEGQIRDIGISAYHSPHISANILSYHKLQETHRVLYDNKEDTFIAHPFLLGPVLHFKCLKGHYILGIDTVLQVFVTSVNYKALKYGKRQLENARRAYDFIYRMGFLRY